MKLRLDEYYYILNINSWCEGIEGCLKEYEECPSMSGAAAYLNTFDVVFYEIEGEIKCFVLKELD